TQPTEWQRIGNQINAAMIFARADFVNVFVHAAGWGNAMVQSSKASAYRVHRNTVTGTCKVSRGGWGAPCFSKTMGFSIDPQPASISPTVNISIVFICGLL